MPTVKTFDTTKLSGLVVDLTVKEYTLTHLKEGKIVADSKLNMAWLDRKTVESRGKTTSFALFSEVIKSLTTSTIGGGSGGVSGKIETLVKLIPLLLSVGIPRPDKTTVKLGDVLYVQVLDGSEGEGKELKFTKKVYLAQDYFARLLSPISMIIEAENRRKDYREGYIFTARPKTEEVANVTTSEEVYDVG